MRREKLEAQIQRLNLDLKGKVVLTEAANGAYVVTPILAAMAGAKVYAFSKNTRYGTAEEVITYSKKIVSSMELSIDINFIDTIKDEIVAEADIITNSGHLRPLNKELLQYAKSSLVIPLMYEAWEWRNGDLDLDYCREKGIKVGATNERHPDIDVFNYLGDMALKLIFDAGFCPYNNRFVLVCNNDFGFFIAKVLSIVCKNLAVCDKKENRYKYKGLQIDWIGNFPDFKAPSEYRNADAVIFSAYPFDHTWIGNSETVLPISKFEEEFNHTTILRFAGDIHEGLSSETIRFYPDRVTSGHMGILPSAIGLDPIIRLQSGGLKSGELMLKNETCFRGFDLVEYVS